MPAPTTTYRMWKRLPSQPGGTRLFSAAAMVRVPYFASIVPHVVRMEPAIAMGMLMEATVPTSHRWIPKSMNVQYLEKATTSLHAHARLDPPKFTSIVMPVSVVPA